MPGETGVQRIALDETSLDFRGIDTRSLEDYLDRLSDGLAELTALGHIVAIHPWLIDSVECLDKITLDSFLYDPQCSKVRRDTRVRFGVALDRCTKWPEEQSGGIDSVVVTVPGSDAETKGIGFSLGVASALQHHLAVLVFPGRPKTGWGNVSGKSGTAEVYFFMDPSELSSFWRALFAAENIAEHDFFGLASHAFPHLIFSPGLRFNRFDGGYRDVRDRVVRILAALNDYFGHAMREHHGIPANVAAELGRHGVDLSPESPSTRANARLMAHRTVRIGEVEVQVEWHAKLERHRNRIHFSLPITEFDNRIVIGIFVDHLPT